MAASDAVAALSGVGERSQRLRDPPKLVGHAVFGELSRWDERPRGQLRLFPPAVRRAR